MREAGARGRHFIARCTRCMLASTPLPAPRGRAERRVRALGWTQVGADDWLCPRCVVRDLDVFFDAPTTGQTDEPLARDLHQRHIVSITCARASAVLPTAPSEIASFEAWAEQRTGFGRSSDSVLKRSLVIELESAPRWPSGVLRVTPREGSIEFEGFDQETLSLRRVRWDVDVEGSMRPDARILRWIKMRQTLRSTIGLGAVTFDLVDSQAWLLPSS